MMKTNMQTQDEDLIVPNCCCKNQMTYSLFSDITSRQLELRISKNLEMPRMSLSGMVQLSQLIDI